MGVRRAFVLASIGGYLIMMINLAATVIMARLLTPTDYGVAVLGGAVLAVAEAIRALAHVVIAKATSESQLLDAVDLALQRAESQRCKCSAG